MKAQSQNTKPFPKPARFTLYLGAVLILSFFNWVALQAEEPTRSLDCRLADALIDEVETEIKLERWMLTFSEDYLMAAESEITLEPWMLSLSEDFLVYEEPELDIEPWMLSISADFIANSEPGITIEDWMTDTFLWETAWMLAKK